MMNQLTLRTDAGSGAPWGRGTLAGPLPRGGTGPLLARPWRSLGVLAGVGLLTACIPPGKGPKAEAGYRHCAPIVEALAAHRAAYGRYPGTLADLADLPRRALPEEIRIRPLKYRSKGNSYRLTFSYQGPGMNHCTHDPERGWRCHGYY